MDLRKIKDKAAEAFTKGKFAKAAELYGDYLAKEKRDHQARLRMGDAWSKSGKKDKAIEAYSAAAEGFAKDGFLPRAIAASKLILELDPAHQGVQQMLAELYAQRGGGPVQPRAANKASGVSSAGSAAVSAAMAAPASAVASPGASSAAASFQPPSHVTPAAPTAIAPPPPAAVVLAPPPPPPAPPANAFDPSELPPELSAEYAAAPAPPPAPAPSAPPPAAKVFDLDVEPSVEARDAEADPDGDDADSGELIDLDAPAPVAASPAPVPNGAGRAEPLAPALGTPPSSERARTPATVAPPASVAPPAPPAAAAGGSASFSPPGLRRRSEPPAAAPTAAPAPVPVPPPFASPAATAAPAPAPVPAPAPFAAAAPPPAARPRPAPTVRPSFQFDELSLEDAPSLASAVSAALPSIALEGETLLHAVERAAEDGQRARGEEGAGGSEEAVTAQPEPAPGEAGPGALPQIPLFSDLTQDAFIELFERCPLHRLGPGERVFTQGSQGDSFFIVCEGKVRVFREEGGARRELATLEDGAFFGEMALLSGAPRSASVESASDDTQLLEISAPLLADLSKRYPQVSTALKNFCRQRLLTNVMNGSALFQPFNRSDRRALVQRFRAREVQAGALVVQEGQTSDGLYVVLAGEVAVEVGGKEVARLKEGELFGEMSLLQKTPASGNVRATQRTSLLRLPRPDFDELISSHPQVLMLVAELSDERRRKNEGLGGAAPEAGGEDFSDLLV